MVSLKVGRSAKSTRGVKALKVTLHASAKSLPVVIAPLFPRVRVRPFRSAAGFGRPRNIVTTRHHGAIVALFDVPKSDLVKELPVAICKGLKNKEDACG